VGGSEGPGRVGEAAGPIDEVPGRRSQSAVSVTTPRVVPAGNTGRARLMRSVIFIVGFVVSLPAATSSAWTYNPTTRSLAGVCHCSARLAACILMVVIIEFVVGGVASFVFCFDYFAIRVQMHT